MSFNPISVIISTEKNRRAEGVLSRFDARAVTLSLLCYLVAMLSLPATDLGDLLVMWCLLIIATSLSGVGFRSILRKGKSGPIRVFNSLSYILIPLYVSSSYAIYSIVNTSNVYSL